MLARSRRSGNPFAVASADIDDFKEINDSCGRQAGDELLHAIAGTLQTHMREVDTVARLGGDEFAVLLSDTDPDEARTVMAKLERLMENLSVADSHGIIFSMGVVAFLKPPESVDEMIRAADHLMYSVKKEGKNSIAYAVWPSGVRTPDAAGGIIR